MKALVRKVPVGLRFGFGDRRYSVLRLGWLSVVNSVLVNPRLVLLSVS